MKRVFVCFALVSLTCGMAHGLGGNLKKKIGPSAEQQTVVVAFVANQKGQHASSQTETPASAYETILAGVRQNYQNPIFAHLGNLMGPTPSTIVSKGRLDFQLVDRQLFNLLHVSNHEFVAGADELQKRIAESRVPVLAGNINLPKSAALRSMLVKRGGRSIAFLGLTTEQFPSLVNENLRKSVSFDSVAEYAQRTLAELKGKADVVVALSDLPDEELEQARSIDGIDIIISSGGSAGTKGQEWISIAFPDSNKASVVRTVPSFPAVYVLELTLTRVGTSWILDELNGDYYPVTAKTPRDKPLDQWVTGQVATIKSKEAEAIGRLATEIKNDDGRQRQTELGTMTTNLLRNLTRAHVAAINSGSFREGLPKGQVTHWDLIGAMPYPSYFIIKRLRGDQLARVVERSNSLMGKGGYLQWSGLTNDPGLGTLVDGAPIIPDKNYDFATLDYLAQGGDGYVELAEARTVAKLKISLQQLCIDYFKKYGTLLIPSLPLDRELNFWFASAKVSGSFNSFLASPDNEINYPSQTSLASQQNMIGQASARLDLNRRDFWFGLDNSVEAQLGLNWDRELRASKAQDLIVGMSQLTLYSTNFLFKGAIHLDPYVSGRLETVMLYPDPFAERSTADSNAGSTSDASIRPGSLQIASGLETKLFDAFSFKLGFRRDSQPFDPGTPPKNGLECVLGLSWYPSGRLPGFESSTEAFTTFDLAADGVNVKSKSSLVFKLGEALSLVPTVELFYNTNVAKLAYVASTRMEVALKF